MRVSAFGRLIYLVAICIIVLVAIGTISQEVDTFYEQVSLWVQGVGIIVIVYALARCLDFLTRSGGNGPE